MSEIFPSLKLEPGEIPFNPGLLEPGQVEDVSEVKMNNNLTLLPIKQEVEEESYSEDYYNDQERVPYHVDTKAVVLPSTSKIKPRSGAPKSKRSSGPEPVMCEQCGKVFANKHNLAAHMKRCNNSFNSKCSICQKRFKSGRSLWLHFQKEHTSIQNDLEDKIAEEEPSIPTSATSTNTILTSKSYSNIALPEPAFCDLCGKTLSSSLELRKHVKRVHVLAKERPFQCPQCPKRFKESGSLNAHVSQLHLEEKFPCDLCKRTVRSPGELWKHKVEGHKMEGLEPPEGVSTLTCEICGVRTLTRGMLKHMEKDHPSNVEDFKRTRQLRKLTVPSKKKSIEARRKWRRNQSEESKRRENERRKIRKREERRRMREEGIGPAWLQKEVNLKKCPECGIQLGPKTNLRQHLKQVHGLEQDGEWVCPRKGCGRRFPLKYYLMDHIRSEQLTILTTLKDNSFVTVKNNENEYGDSDPLNLPSWACAICGKEFSEKDETIIHFMLKHEQTLDKIGVEEEMRLKLKNSSESLTCLYCSERNFGNRKELLAHFEVMHKEKCLKCPEVNCRRNFLSNEDLQEHSLLEHSTTSSQIGMWMKKIKGNGTKTSKNSANSNPKQNREHFQFQCPVCPDDDLYFENVKEMTAHFNMIHPNKLYSCDKCNLPRFTERSYVSHQLETHRVRMSELSDAQRSVLFDNHPTSCELCNAKFILSTYRKHLKRVHGITEDGNLFQCSCPKVFRKREVWMMHMEEFHRGKPNDLLKIASKVNMLDNAGIGADYKDIPKAKNRKQPTQKKRGPKPKRKRKHSETDDDEFEQNDDHNESPIVFITGETQAMLKPCVVLLEKLTQVDIEKFSKGRSEVSDMPEQSSEEPDLEYYEDDHGFTALSPSSPPEMDFVFGNLDPISKQTEVLNAGLIEEQKIRIETFSSLETSKAESKIEFRLLEEALAPKVKKSGPFICDHCGKMFNHRLAFIRHIQQVHENPETPFDCQFCTAKFRTRQLLKNHVKELHKEENTMQGFCDICGKDLKAPGLLWHHKREVHKILDANPPHGVTPMPCYICGKEVLQKLIRHIRRCHPDYYEEYKAGEEEKKKNDKMASILRKKEKDRLREERRKLLRRRLKALKPVKLSKKKQKALESRERALQRAANPNRKPPRPKRSSPHLCCPHCSEMFIREKDMKAHFTEFHSQSLFQCLECTRPTHKFTRRAFISHFANKHKQKAKIELTEEEKKTMFQYYPFTCTLCQGSILLCHFKDHLNSVHGIEENGDLWKCPCPKQFTTREFWMTHMEELHGGKEVELLELAKKINSKDEVPAEEQSLPKIKERGRETLKKRKEEKGKRSKNTICLSTPQLCCPTCGEMFSKEKDIIIHFKEQHPGSLWECKECKSLTYKFTKRAYYTHFSNKHKQKARIELGDKRKETLFEYYPSSCDLCGVNFLLCNYKDHLKRVHGITEDGDLWKCPCPKKFNTREFWMTHMEELHGGKEEDLVAIAAKVNSSSEIPPSSFTKKPRKSIKKGPKSKRNVVVEDDTDTEDSSDEDEFSDSNFPNETNESDVKLFNEEVLVKMEIDNDGMNEEF